MQSDLLIEQISPHGNLQAFVEQDRRVAYLYLQGPADTDFGVRSCWIRNLAEAPATLQTDEMKRGVAPMLPADFCAPPSVRPALNPSSLSVVWFIEGDGVALLENGEMIATIPPWSGHSGFNGYARDCVGESPLCWKLGDDTVIRKRIEDAQKYWQKWTDNALLWDQIQNGFIYGYESVLGKHDRYFAIDGEVWPPKVMVNINTDQQSFFMTVGVSVRPQPKVELFFEDPTSHQRIELAACFDRNVNPETINAFAGYLSGLTAMPWASITFLGHGHTIACDVFANDPSLNQFVAIVLVEDPPGAPKFDLPEVDDQPVKLLWAIPITATELDMLQGDNNEAAFNQLLAIESIATIRNRKALK